MDDKQPIRLDQFLKLVNAVGSGGEAKHLVQSGLVRVNNEVETRRGRKLTNGDVVRLTDTDYVVNIEQQ
ncbi:MAG: RNA-binding S4 domain-containing protein [Candidatus Obscuribacterales bacterium]|nr:MAG: RNA-binding S4 domain-containing protein [Candidatus Melainabacteria bacterium]